MLRIEPLPIRQFKTHFAEAGPRDREMIAASVPFGSMED